MDDLISRQDAIDAVKKYDFYFPQYMERFVTELGDAMKSDLANDIKALPAAQSERKWIPCSERMPDIMVPVLITMKRGKGYNQEPFQSVGHLDANGYTWWCAHDGTCTHQTVLAWMPLPEPYQGGDNT